MEEIIGDKRSRRIHDREVMKARAKRIHRDIPEWANKNYNHLASCSCVMCGNPRKYFHSRTLQERKADLALRDDC